jgi:hypothetical protein
MRPAFELDNQAPIPEPLFANDHEVERSLPELTVRSMMEISNTITDIDQAILTFGKEDNEETDDETVEEAADEVVEEIVEETEEEVSQRSLELQPFHENWYLMDTDRPFDPTVACSIDPATFLATVDVETESRSDLSSYWDSDYPKTVSDGPPFGKAAGSAEGSIPLLDRQGSVYSDGFSVPYGITPSVSARPSSRASLERTPSITYSTIIRSLNAPARIGTSESSTSYATQSSYTPSICSGDRELGSTGAGSDIDFLPSEYFDPEVHRILAAYTIKYRDTPFDGEEPISPRTIPAHTLAATMESNFDPKVQRALAADTIKSQHSPFTKNRSASPTTISNFEPANATKAYPRPYQSDLETILNPNADPFASKTADSQADRHIDPLSKWREDSESPFLCSFDTSYTTSPPEFLLPSTYRRPSQVSALSLDTFEETESIESLDALNSDCMSEASICCPQPVRMNTTPWWLDASGSLGDGLDTLAELRDIIRQLLDSPVAVESESAYSESANASNPQPSTSTSSYSAGDSSKATFEPRSDAGESASDTNREFLRKWLERRSKRRRLQPSSDTKESTTTAKFIEQWTRRRTKAAARHEPASPMDWWSFTSLPFVPAHRSSATAMTSPRQASNKAENMANGFPHWWPRFLETIAPIQAQVPDGAGWSKTVGRKATAAHVAKAATVQATSAPVYEYDPHSTATWGRQRPRLPPYLRTLPFRRLPMLLPFERPSMSRRRGQPSKQGQSLQQRRGHIVRLTLGPVVLKMPQAAKLR